MNEHVININGTEYGAGTIEAVYTWASLNEEQFMGAEPATQQRFIDMFNDFNQLTADYNALPEETHEEELF